MPQKYRIKHRKKSGLKCHKKHELAMHFAENVYLCN